MPIKDKEFIGSKVSNENIILTLPSVADVGSILRIEGYDFINNIDSLVLVDLGNDTYSFGKWIKTGESEYSLEILEEIDNE